jgi:PAS domain S-box-containing protein
MTNAATARLFQKPIGEIVGQECFREFEKRDGVCAHCPGAKAMATGRKAVVETTGVRDDGSRFIVRLQAFPQRGPDGRITGFIEVVEDITERKAAGEALRESEERFRLVFEKAPIGIMHYDQTSTVTECNEKFAEIIGAPKEKFIGFNMIRQLQDDQMRKAVAASLGGQVGYYEGDYLSVTAGKLTPVRAIYQPIFSPEGVISGGITIFEDITERQRAESELRLKERLLDSASDSIFLYDLEGNFLYVNEAAYITRWYGKEELLSLGAWALKTPEAAVYQDNILRELWANGELIFESEHRRKDGSVIPVEIFARILAVEGRELILSVARDITERKQAETQVRQGLDSLHQALQGTVVALANTVEIKDPYTAGHQRRVAQLSCAMARELGWPADRIEGIQVLCFLHDLGKIAVPAEILNKPGKISPTEFSLIKVHPQVGYDILKDIAFPWPVAQGVLQHHERLDGSGYPSGLTAEEITPEAKILAVADVVEAMVSHRPYRPALGISEALEEITPNRGKLYDPDAVDVCIRLLTEKDFQFD